MLGKIEGRRRGQQRVRWLDVITRPMDMSLTEQTPGDSEGQGSLVCCSPLGHKESNTSATEQQQQHLRNEDTDSNDYVTCPVSHS